MDLGAPSWGGGGKTFVFLHIFVKISTPPAPPNLGLDLSWGGGVLTPTPPDGSIPALTTLLFSKLQGLF